MPKVKFTGRIFPAALSVSITNFPAIQWQDAQLIELDLQPICRAQVQNNAVTINVDLNKFDPGVHLTPIAMRAHDTVRAAVDLMCFATGNGLIFLLETWTIPDGFARPLAPQQPELAALSTAVSDPSDFDSVLRIVLTDPPLFMALRDLIEAITQWHKAPTSAGRAVEAMRHSMTPNEERRQQWEKLCTNLQIERSYIDPITNTSTGPRHGDPEHIPGTITSDVARRAWVIMNRFLEFKKRGGSQPLPVEEFPILTGDAQRIG